MKRAALIGLAFAAYLLALGALPVAIVKPYVDAAVRDCIGRPVFDHDGFRCEAVTP